MVPDFHSSRGSSVTLVVERRSSKSKSTSCERMMEAPMTCDRSTRKCRRHKTGEWTGFQPNQTTNSGYLVPGEVKKALNQSTDAWQTTAARCAVPRNPQYEMSDNFRRLGGRSAFPVGSPVRSGCLREEFRVVRSGWVLGEEKARPFFPKSSIHTSMWAFRGTKVCSRPFFWGANLLLEG